MKKMVIQGKNALYGKTKISGSKNAALPILASTLLSEDKNTIFNIPNLTDTATIIAILQSLGVAIENGSDNAFCCTVTDDKCYTAPKDLVDKMRASICILGPLIAKRKKAKVPFPGGCVIGDRPIDLHIKGLRELGAHIEIKNGYIEAHAQRLIGKEIFLGGSFGSTVLGTANVMMAATLAEGKTIIRSAACEPEIEDLAHFLNKMGAQISGIGTNDITIEGVSRLKGTTYHVIPDRIEAGTLMIAGAITKGNILLENVAPEHLSSVINTLKEIGVEIHIDNNIVQIIGSNDYIPYCAQTHPYPGFPTDLQAQLLTLLTLIEGNSVVTENIYPDRFMHVLELKKLGASLHKENASVYIQGVDKLYGTDVVASDLRASAALVLAGLVAQNKTTIHNIHHLQRGYENLQQKLVSLGADITVVDY